LRLRSRAPRAEGTAAQALRFSLRFANFQLFRSSFRPQPKSLQTFSEDPFDICLIKC
jgi:hypothetical protein